MVLLITVATVNLLSISQSTGKEVAVDEVDQQTSWSGCMKRGPVGAKEFTKYRVNGFVFSPSIMKKKLVAQDSGFCIAADTTFRSKKANEPQRLKCGVGISEKPNIGSFQHLMVDELDFLCWCLENNGVCQLRRLGSHP